MPEIRRASRARARALRDASIAADSSRSNAGWTSRACQAARVGRDVSANPRPTTPS